MPVLPSLPHEQFCVAKAKGATNADAARIAGFKSQTPGNTAFYLLNREDIRTRIEELTAEYAANPPPEMAMPEPEKPSREWIVQKYMLAVKMAEQREDRGNFVKALDSLAKLEGFMIERTETRTGPLDQLSAEQLQAMVAFATSMRGHRLAAPSPTITVDVSSDPVTIRPAEDDCE